jgi:phage terminase large subunit-like protein
MGAALNLASLTPGDRAELSRLLGEVARRQGQRFLDTMFPARGPLRRELYAKHLEFFRLGKWYSERVFLAGNRVGKTMAAGTEWSYHLTGMYPDWWEGHAFNRPITTLVAGDTLESTRDILQDKLLGTDDRDRPEKIGTGLIPGRCIKAWVPRVHVKGAIEKAIIKRVSGGGDISNAGESELWLRSYEQGRKIFQGFELDGFWPDEECPQDVYDEGQVRLMTTKGISTLTFTPLEGLTELVLNLLADADLNASNGEAIIHAAASRAIVMCGWDDVPHLDTEAKAKLYAKLPPHQRDARTKGIPSLGAGAIYPVPEDDVVVADFPIPAHWPRFYAMDVGWNRTCVLFFAWDRDNDVLYVYREHYRGQAEPSIHAEAVRALAGKWMQGAIDPASRGRSQADGQQLLQQYRDLGLQLTEADNGVESGIYEVWQRLSTGRLKFFKSLGNTRGEYRIYRRDDKGKIVKKNDHAMDTLRYGTVSGPALARCEPIEDDDRRRRIRDWKTS